METSIEDKGNEQREQYLWKIGNILSTTCPAASRYYLYNLEKSKVEDASSSKKNNVKRSNLYCNHCGSLWTADNHRVRVQPPPKPCGYIKALLKKSKTDPMMKRKERKKVKKFLEKQQSKIVYTCFLCKKEMKFPGIVKPGRQALKVVSYSTPLPKMKVKKRDLTAGLFLHTPPDHSKNERVNSSVDLTNSKDLSEVRSSSPAIVSSTSEKPNQNTPTPVTGNIIAMSLSNPSPNSSASKLKRTLKTLSPLTLNEKQKTSKKKKSILSSFLVSL